MKMADILLLEDDNEYAGAVRRHFESLTNAYLLTLYHARAISDALTICGERDIRVAIIDLSLPDGELGTDVISAISEFDKKVLFIIHTVHSPHAIANWCATIGIPYTSLFFLQKSGDQVLDLTTLHDLVVKALRSYVPHFPPTLMSVRDVIETIDAFSEDHRSFRRTAIVSNIHRSQDVLNAGSQWAADRLARMGYDSTRVAVVMTGSFARLEGGSASDADYFVVFDDLDLTPEHLSMTIRLAYRAFLDTGLWFERNSIEVHGYQSEEKRPDKIVWHTSTLPTWFPISSFLSARLGRSTQLELTRQWFLLESFPIFNAALLHEIRQRIENQMSISDQPTCRDVVAHSSLPESFQLLSEEFDFSFRHRRRDSLFTVKHYFMRLMNLFSIRLWLLRTFLDPAVFEAPPSRLFEEFSPHPLARIIHFYNFLRRGSFLTGKSLKDTLSHLEMICNRYAETAQSFGLKAIREPPLAGDNALVNDLVDAGQGCEVSMLAVLRALAGASEISTHPEIALRRIL
jgi:ActR/RegA family two-component response regulator